MEKENTELRTFSSDNEVAEFVLDVARRSNAVIVDEMLKLNERDRFLIMSRIINLIFDSHFQVTMEISKRYAAEKSEKGS